MSNQILAGRVALVTGAASGAATAKAFCEAGAAVLLADVLADAGEAVAAELRDAGGQAAFVRCDMQAERAIAGAVARAAAEFGALHIAFNNAGVEGEQGATAECTNENWDRVLDVNLSGVWWRSSRARRLARGNSKCGAVAMQSRRRLRHRTCPGCRWRLVGAMKETGREQGSSATRRQSRPMASLPTRGESLTRDAR